VNSIFPRDNFHSDRTIFRILRISAVLSSIFIGLVIISPSFAVETPFFLSLDGPWKIHLGDDPSWADPKTDDSSWDSVDMPGSIARYALDHQKGTIGYVWLRKKIAVPRNTVGKKLGVGLGRIAQVDEAYFNGEKIGSQGQFPPNELTSWNIPRYYAVPERLVIAGGENIIAMRVWIHTFGHISGDLFISGEDAWKNRKANGFFAHVIMNYVIIAMGIPLAILFSLFYIRRPRQTEYLYYSLQLVCGFFIIFDLCSLWRFPGGTSMAFRSVAFSWIAINVVHPIFLHRLYGLQRKKVEIGLVSYILIAIFFFIAAKPEDFRYYGLLVVSISGSIGFYNLSCHFSALYLRRPYAKVFSFFGLTVVAGAIHDGANYLTKLLYIRPVFFGYPFDVMIFPYTAAALYIGTALILVHRFIEVLKANEDLNENLEIKVEERTRSLILLTEELERQNIRLEEMVIRDGLTGLYNHRALFDRLDEIFMTCRKNRMPMAVVMIDVDDFKGINDRFGHQVGDRVLTTMAGILKTCIREYDIADKYLNNRMADNRDYDLAGRYGGDEFVMVLPQCDETLAVQVTERICQRVRDILMEGSPDLKVSGSFGVAVLLPDVRCPNSEKLVTLADLDRKSVV
jgi:GGDEF domain-containing protein